MLLSHLAKRTNTDSALHADPHCQVQHLPMYLLLFRETCPFGPFALVHAIEGVLGDGSIALLALVWTTTDLVISKEVPFFVVSAFPLDPVGPCCLLQLHTFLNAEGGT